MVQDTRLERKSSSTLFSTRSPSRDPTLVALGSRGANGNVRDLIEEPVENPPAGGSSDAREPSDAFDKVLDRALDGLGRGTAFIPEFSLSRNGQTVVTRKSRYAVTNRVEYPNLLYCAGVIAPE